MGLYPFARHLTDTILALIHHTHHHELHHRWRKMTTPAPSSAHYPKGRNGSSVSFVSSSSATRSRSVQPCRCPCTHVPGGPRLSPIRTSIPEKMLSISTPPSIVAIKKLLGASEWKSHAPIRQSHPSPFSSTLSAMFFLPPFLHPTNSALLVLTILLAS